MTQIRSHRLLLALLAGLAVIPAARAALASSTPVGPLPAGPTVTISAARGTTVALSLPTPKPKDCWRCCAPGTRRSSRTSASRATCPATPKASWSARSPARPRRRRTGRRRWPAGRPSARTRTGDRRTRRRRRRGLPTSRPGRRRAPRSTSALSIITIRVRTVPTPISLNPMPASRTPSALPPASCRLPMHPSRLR